ncbi:glutamyl-tRNA reductase [Secundilactobacillus paracollinoides]|uniref:glutamyl-tRNA reductase n=1 Tax=Secundilactobacillus paracollinoides TaxID=240427 RepID=UPI0006D0721B|nr:glutamyl-tRNA reductase [Secundilactobacillus paracollinoides]ANZ64432.1 glutamyl-tRNA reductase [Secundilactobacillus paracollinoides]KRL76095.1 glutamyl-tRNA reductase [Secundilactobacillus paracollinoides DSM 15502 = JCM 11969]
MFVIYVSLNYQQLPITTREQLVFSKDELTRANALLSDEKSILENMILSTCNRTEVYAVVDQIHTGRYYIKRFLANWFHVSIDQITQWAQIGFKQDAVAHLLRVTTGLESLIVGEPQILGQVKEAFFTARDQGTTGVILNHLAKTAITFAKKQHTTYRVSELAKTSGQTGLHQIKLSLKDLTDKHLVIAGLGDVGTHVLKNASTMGFQDITILNRTNERATALAASYGETVQAADWDKLAVAANAADAVVLATSAKQPVLNGHTLASGATNLKTVVDLGVPRNVHSEDLPTEITYFDIDHLTAIISENQMAKGEMLEAMAAQVPAAVDAFFVWQQQLHVVPVIQEIRESALDVEKTAYDSLLRKLPELDAHQRKVISKHMKSIINQMILGPIKSVKELSLQDDADLDLAFVCQIFGLSTDLVKQEQPYEK